MLNYTDYAYLDWEKTFDRIDQILLNANVRTQMLNALKAMYTQMTSTLYYRNTKSTPCFSKVGVKQGSPAIAYCVNSF